MLATFRNACGKAQQESARHDATIARQERIVLKAILLRHTRHVQVTAIGAITRLFVVAPAGHDRAKYYRSSRYYYAASRETTTIMNDPGFIFGRPPAPGWAPR